MIEPHIPPRFSMWSSYFIDLAPEDAIAEIAVAGFRHADLSDEHSHALVARGGDASAAGRSFARGASDRGVSVTQAHLWLCCDVAADDQGATLDTLRRWLDLYLGIGITAAVIHPGAWRLGGAEDPRHLDANAAALSALARHVAGTPLRLAVENLVRHGPDPETVLRLVRMVGGPNVGVCLDTGHLNVAKGDPAAYVAAVGDLLIATHLHDNEGASDQHILPYARGTVPWPKVMRALREAGYAGLLDLEIPGENRAGLAVRRAKLGYAREVCAELAASAA